VPRPEPAVFFLFRFSEGCAVDPVFTLDFGFRVFLLSPRAFSSVG
jgi:hypothetical protein